MKRVKRNLFSKSKLAALTAAVLLGLYGTSVTGVAEAAPVIVSGGGSEKLPANIFTVGGSYQFDKTFGLNAAAAWNTKKDMGYDGSKRSWQVEATFGKEDQKKAGNVTGYVAYRHLGNSVSWRPDYEVMNSGQKGWDVGVKYVIYKDIVASLRYFRGKAIKDDTNENTLFGEVYCYF